MLRLKLHPGSCNQQCSIVATGDYHHEQTAKIFAQIPWIDFSQQARSKLSMHSKKMWNDIYVDLE